MRQVVLRKSHGSASAGTPITTVEADERGIPREDLTLLRNRVDEVPAVARIDRSDRVAKRQLYNLKQLGKL